MISCEIVGNVSFVIANELPTVMTNGVHDARNNFESFVNSLPNFKYGILENSRDVVVTLAANSIHTFNTRKATNPIPDVNSVKNIPVVTLKRTATKRPKITTDSPPMTNAGRRIENISIAQT